ncbi:MAG: class I SAM-dependent methyltransferase [Candidatus Bathyarchaeia archaeon]
MGIKSFVKVRVCRTEMQAWDTIWKWSWFTRKVWVPEYLEETRSGLQPLFSLLPKLHVKSILDCSCGLGFKTVMFAKEGYEVEGSDASAVAINHAPKIAEEEGLKIRFFRSRFDNLGKNCKRKYDCVFSDYFDELSSLAMLKASAKGIYSVLNQGGKFIFYTLFPNLTKSDLKKSIEREWKKRKKFAIDQPVEHDDMRIIHIEVGNKTVEGILETNIYLVEKKGVLEAEVASIMNPRIKWRLKDYVNVLIESGFRKVNQIKRKKEVIIVALK